MVFIDSMSPSRYNTSKTCWHMYLSKYVDRIPPKESKKGNGAAQFGSFIHKVFELGTSATTLEELDSLARHYRPDYNFPKVFDEKTAICLKNFLKLNKKLEETIATEFSYTLPVKEGMPPIKGVIDRIVKGKTGKYLILDYKTGKEKTKGELFTDYQLQDYVVAVSVLFKCQVKDIVCAHFYPISGDLVSISYSSGQAANHINEMINQAWKIRKMKRCDFFPMKNDLCPWCNYSYACPVQVDNAGMIYEQALREVQKENQK